MLSCFKVQGNVAGPRLGLDTPEGHVSLEKQRSARQERTGMASSLPVCFSSVPRMHQFYSSGFKSRTFPEYRFPQSVSLKEES